MDVPAPLWAHVDPLRISQALDNLVSNAIKYSPDGGTVRISASTGNGRVRLQVVDNGMGMTAADAGRVFTRFFRSPAVREGSVPGAGLGCPSPKPSWKAMADPSPAAAFRAVAAPSPLTFRPRAPPPGRSVGTQGPGQLGPGQQSAVGG